MCPYCANQNRKKYKLKEQRKNGDYISAFYQDLNTLVINMNWYDNFYHARINCSSAIKINYCPWCGENLNINKGK